MFIISIYLKFSTNFLKKSVKIKKKEINLTFKFE
jgi:hypothetical protein